EATSRWPRRAVRSARPMRARRQVEQLEDRAVPSINNVLVNDPAMDDTAQDTQSETAIVLGAGNRVIVAYNDSGSAVGGARHFSGYAVSSNGGSNFSDKGTLPASPAGDGADPALARSDVTGTIFLAVTAPNPAFNGPSEMLNVFRSADNGVSFSPPVNGAPGLVAGVDANDK